MRKYGHLTKEDIYEALNKIRDAFLAARDGSQVNDIMDSILTSEEKIMIGRRVLAVEYLKSGYLTIAEIRSMLKMGTSTIMNMARQSERYPKGFELIETRSKRVESEYQKKKYRKSGGSTLVFKRKEYTGIRRKDIRR